MTHLSRYCLHLIEACWLAAVVVVPLLFNRLGTQGFEPDKMAWVRVLAMVVGAAWVVRGADAWWSEGRRPRFDLRAWVRRPLAWAVVAWVAASVLSTVFSLQPRISWRGSYEMSAGLASGLALLVLGAAVAVHCRTPGQHERLVTTILVTSLPVSVYGMMQRAGWDPVGMGTQAIQRVFSTLGHPVYLGAYLAMVLPLTLWRVIQWWESRKAVAGGRKRRTIGVVLYGTLAGIQVTALVLTESRGPFLGALAGIAVLGAAWYFLRPSMARLMVPCGAMTAAILLAGVLETGGQPGSALQELPMLGRFASDPDDEGARSSGRRDLWPEAPRLLARQEPPLGADGSPDRWPALRRWVGYGPETLPGLLSQSFSAFGPEVKWESRFHNLTWDLWAATGLVGAIAWFGLVLGVLGLALRGLGVLRSGRDTAVFGGLATGLGLVGAALLGSWKGAGYAGLGWQAGLVGAVVATPLLASLRRGAAEPEVRPAGGLSPGLVPWLGAVAGHLAETAFSFQVAASSTLFWIGLGCLVGTVSRLKQDSLPASPRVETAPQGAGSGSPGKTPARPIPRDPRAPEGPADDAGFGIRWAALVGILMGVCLLAPKFVLYSRGSLGVPEVLVRAIGGGAGSGEPWFWVALFCGLACFALIADARVNGAAWAHGPAALLKCWGTCGLTLAVYSLLAAGIMAGIGPFPGAFVPVDRVVGQGNAYAALFGLAAAILMLALLAGAWPRLPRSPAIPRAQVARPVWAALALSALAVALGAGLVEGRRVRADLTAHWGDVLRQEGLPAASTVFARAVQADPVPFHYRSRWAHALLDQSATATNPAAFSRLISEAEGILKEARQRDGLNRSSYHLGRLYLRWALRETQPERRAELSRQAAESLARAVRAEPRTELVWTEAAVVDRLLLGREEDARRKLAEADAIAAPQPPTRYAEYYLQRSRDPGSPAELQRQYLARAMDYYGIAARQETAQGRSPLRFHLTNATLAVRLGDRRAVIAPLEQAVAAAHQAERGPLELRLARAHLDVDEPALAAEVLRRSLEKSPDSLPQLELLAFVEYQKLEDHGNALAHFLRVLELKPDHPKRDEYTRVIDYLTRRSSNRAP